MHLLFASWVLFVNHSLICLSAWRNSNKDPRRSMAMFRLDYLSCLLTVLATILVGRKMWTGLVVSGLNSLIVCVIGLHTSQYGFIPANVFCICINAFNLRAWLKSRQIHPHPPLTQAMSADK